MSSMLCIGSSGLRSARAVQLLRFWATVSEKDHPFNLCSVKPQFFIEQSYVSVLSIHSLRCRSIASRLAQIFIVDLLNDIRITIRLHLCKRSMFCKGSKVSLLATVSKRDYSTSAFQSVKYMLVEEHDLNIVKLVSFVECAFSEKCCGAFRAGGARMKS